MSAVRGVASAISIILASLSMASSARADAADLARVDTDFGYVLVDPADVEAAIAEGRAAREAAKRVLLLPDVRFAIIEEGTGADRWGSFTSGYVIYNWPFPNGTRRSAARPATRVLRHEIGHDLLARHSIPGSGKDQYGTNAPDWLDEMAAIAFEGSEEQSDRRRAARRRADAGLLPLSKLFSMTHPEFRPSSPIGDSQVVATSQPTSDDTMRFYATIQAFYDFLLDRTGNKAIIAELANAFVQGADLQTWIVERVEARPGHTSLAQLNGDFVQWFSRDPRYAV